MIGSIKKMLQGNSYYLEDKSEFPANETTVSAPAIEEKPEPVKVETVKPQAAPIVEVKPVQPSAPTIVSPSTSNPLELIKASVQKPTTQAQEKSEEGGSTFAPDYLLYTKTQAKRRPGACMDSFLKMAQKR